MNRLLVIGASNLQLPAIKKAKEIGLYVGVVDYNPNAIGIIYSDEYFNCSTIDQEGVLAIAQRFIPDGIMTMATDMPMRTVAYVCEKLRLNAISVDTSIVATDKLKMIERFKRFEIASPWYFNASTYDQLLAVSQSVKYPCVIKPTDSSGSRGVALCQTAQELLAQYDYAKDNSINHTVIIEEYMVGNEVSVEVFAENGDVHVLQITDKLTTGAPHFVEMGHSQPTQLTNLKEISDLAKKSVLALDILNGPAHVEIMNTEDGAKVIEIGARMGGDCITSHLVPLSTGIDMTENTILYSLGRKLQLEKKLERASAIRFIEATGRGIITQISGIEDARKCEGVVEVVLTKNVDDAVTEICSSNDRIGYVIAQAETAREAIEFCQRALRNIKIEVI